MCSVFTTIKVQSVRLCLNWLQFIHVQIVIMTLLMKHAYFQLYFTLYIFCIPISLSLWKYSKGFEDCPLLSLPETFQAVNSLASLRALSGTARWTAGRNPPFRLSSLCPPVAEEVSSP